MGKKTKFDLDIVELPENGTEPKLDLVAIEEPGKKKDPTTSAPSLENGTIPPGSSDSSQPAPKATEPSKKPTPEEEDNWFLKISDFFASAPRAAITSAYNVIANQIPQEFKTEDLRMSHGSLNDYINPSKREGSANIQSSGFEFPEANEIKNEYRQWSNKQPYSVRSLPNDERVEKFFATKNPQEVDKLRKSFQGKIADYRLKLESEVQSQKKDSEKIMKGIPQSVRDVSSVQDGIELAGKFVGEGVGRIVTSALTAGGGSIIAERAAVFDRQLDQMAEIVAKKTGADQDIARRMIIKYQQDKPEEGRVVGDLAALLDIVSLPVAAGKLGKVIAPVAEGLTETAQSEMEEAGASIGSGADYGYDPIRSVDSFLGGVLGSGGIQMLAGGNKSKPIAEVVKEESAALSTENIEGIEKAAENIEKGGTAPIDAVEVVDMPDIKQETTGEAPVTAPENKSPEGQVQEGEVVGQGTEAGTSLDEDTRQITEAEQVAQQYNEEVSNPTILSPVESAITQELGKINNKSFKRFSDANKITTGMAKSYFSKEGEDLDQVAQRVSYSLYPEGNGTEITPENVAEFIERFPGGVNTAFTPSGNPKLAELANKYSDLTGKAINRRTAKSISDSIVKSVGNEGANTESSRLFDEQNELSLDKLIDEMEADPDRYMSQWGLTQEEFDYQLNAAHHEKGKQGPVDEGNREDGGLDQQGQGSVTEGGPLSQRFGNAAKDPAQSAQEIKSKQLTHVPGLNMGKGLSAGTYVSTEDANRYQKEGSKPQPVTVDISKPFEFLSEDGIIPFRNQVLNDNFDKFNEQDFEDGNVFRRNATIEDMSMQGIDKLADLVRENLQSEGYDSIYLPETETQEGELIVFDTKNVKIGNVSSKPTTATKVGGEQQADIGQQPTSPESTTTPTEVLSENEPPSAKPPQNDNIPPELGAPSNTRETVKKLREESKLDQELKDGIEQFEKYDPRTHSQAREEARKYIESVGEDKALIEAGKFKWMRSQEQKIAVLSELADQFSTQYKESIKSSDEKAQTAAYNKFIEAMDILSSNITDTAQALSYLNLVGTIFETKTGANRFAKNQIEDSREGALKNYEPLVLNAKKIIEEFDKLSKDEFMESKQVQDLIAQYKKPKSIQSKIAAKRVRDAGERLKQLWKENQNLGIIWDPKSQAKKDLALQKAVIDYVKAVVKKILVDTGEKIQAIRDEVVSEVKSFGKGIGLEIPDSDLSEIVDKQISETQISEAEKKYKGDLKKAVEDFVKGDIKSKQDLIDKIVESEELNKVQAKKFTDSFEKLFNDYASKKKEQIVKKYTPKEKPKEAKKKKEFYDKVIELSNSGAVSDQQLNDTVANIFDLPMMTPEITTKIDALVEGINKAPEGRFKNIAITKLTDYITQQQKFNVTNYMLASYKAGIFSGIDTQALNLQGNFFNVLELGFILGISNPFAGGRFYKAMANPKNLSRAGLEALQTMRTGYDPRMPGDKRRALEQTPRSFFGMAKPLKGWKQAFDPTLEQQKKYVFRALSAGDLLFSVSINDALQNELYTRQAKKKGLRGKEAKEYIRQQMGYTPENIQKTGEVAKKEAQDGSIPNDANSITLRTYELIEQQRDPDIVEKSRQYASEQIMTNSPKGFIGEVAKGLNHMIQRLPVLSAFIPVVNFAANAMSRAVQYMPHTAALRAILHGADRKIKGEDISTQWKDFMSKLKDGDIDTEMRLRRAAVGVISVALLIGLTDEDDDGENILSQLLGKPVKIHGFGPGTQFNRQKNYQKQESGWLPYSIQVGDKFIPYRNYPALNVLLATIGEWNDAKRYGKLDRKDSTYRLLFALGGSFKVIAEMGFLTSMNTLIEAMLTADPEKIVDSATKTPMGFAFPKFQRNLTNLFDNKLYSRNGVQELVTRSIPVINSYSNEPLVNALGEPIEKNWWDRINLWQKSAYSKHEPLWSANNDKQYYFPVPNKFSIEQKFDRMITSKEFNDYFKNRGDIIAKEWKPSMAKLSKEEYKTKMDELTRYADYRALVKMGVMNSSPMKDIKHQLYDVYSNKRDMQKLRQELKP